MSEQAPRRQTPHPQAPSGPAPPGPAPPGPAPPRPARGRQRFGGSVLLRIAVALLVGPAAYLVNDFALGDRAKDARVGDCIASGAPAADRPVETRARVVDCTSAEAAFTVAGRVTGETDTESPACDRFFRDGERFLVFSSTAGGGYLLCLRPKG